jgi:hypothetical protein
MFYRYHLRADLTDRGSPEKTGSMLQDMLNFDLFRVLKPITVFQS